MPRQKKTRLAHPTVKKIHRDRIGEYRIGEHVVIVGRGDNPKKYIVKIVDLWDTLEEDKDEGVKETIRERGSLMTSKFTAKYYYYPSDLPKTFVHRIPKKCVGNEIFLSNFTADNSFGAIVSKCHVFNAPVVKKVTIQGDVYVCRYQFFPWNVVQPFAALVTASPRHVSVSDGKKECSEEFQAVIPPLVSRSNAMAVKEMSTPIWSTQQSLDMGVQTYLFLLHCLLLAHGNVAYAWQSDLKEEVECLILSHFPDGRLQVSFFDGSGTDIVHPRHIRGLISDDEALERLHHLQYNYPLSLLHVSKMLVERNKHAKDNMMMLRKQRHLKMANVEGSIAESVDDAKAVKTRKMYAKSMNTTGSAKAPISNSSTSSAASSGRRGRKPKESNKEEKKTTTRTMTKKRKSSEDRRSARSTRQASKAALARIYQL